MVPQMENRFEFKTEVTVPSQETSIPPQHELAFNLGGTEIGKLACLLTGLDPPRPSLGSVDVVSSFHRKPLPE